MKRHKTWVQRHPILGRLVVGLVATVLLGILVGAMIEGLQKGGGL